MKHINNGCRVKIAHKSWGKDNGLKGRYIVEDDCPMIVLDNGGVLGIDPSHLKVISKRHTRQVSPRN